MAREVAVKVSSKFKREGRAVKTVSEYLPVTVEDT